MTAILDTGGQAPGWFLRKTLGLLSPLLTVTLGGVASLGLGYTSTSRGGHEVVMVGESAVTLPLGPSKEKAHGY